MSPKSMLRSRHALIALAIAGALVVSLLTLLPRIDAQARDRAATPVAPPGPGPVNRPLPVSARPNHGLPPGVEPPVVPPGTRAAGPARQLSAAQWARVPKPAALGGRRVTGADGPPPPSSAGAKNLLLRSGFALDDTSLVVYFDAADPGISGWASWLATVYDPDTGAAQESRPLGPSDAIGCGIPRQFCRSFGTTDGWSLVADHGYFITITVTLADGTQAVSDASGTAKARATATPPALPAQQAAGCACGDALAPTAAAQAVRGLGVNTGTGGFSLTFTDLRMAGFGVPFRALRMYSSGNPNAGAFGVGWSWTYDVRVIPPAAGQSSVTVRAEDGAQVVYSRATDGSYVRPPGVRSTLTASSDGWRLMTPNQIRYTFDQTGRLTSVLDPRGHGVTLAYTATRWTITDAPGRKVIVDLGTDGLIKKITLPDGRNTRYTYDRGLLTTATDAAGDTWTFGYDGALLSQVTDPQHRVQVTNRYAAGRVAEQVDALGAATRFRWDAGKEQATTLDPDGVSYLDGYRGNVLVFSRNGNSDTIVQRYTPSLDPNLLVDPQANQTVSTFDTAGNLTSSTAPDPFTFTTASTYDAHNNLTSYTDGRGNRSNYSYDPFDGLATAQQPDGGRTIYTTDDRGLVISQEDPRHKVTTMTYDTFGNLLTRTSPMGEKTTFSYDPVGRKVTTTDARGNLPGTNPADFTMRFVYDNLDRMRKAFAPGKKKPTETDYDEVGQVMATRDPLGNETKYRYTRVIRQLSALTDPNGRTATFTYTPAGRRASATDPAGNRTTYTYDTRGNLATMVSPRGNVKGANPADFTTSYFYDANNNLLRTRHPYPGGGFVDLDSQFDELDRPVADIDGLGKVHATGYDNNDNVVSTVDPAKRTVTTDYDPNNRPATVISPAGGRTVTEYDQAGNPTRRVSPTGGVTTWTYNDDGDLAAMVDPRGNAPGANPADYTTSYSYDADRNRITETDPLGHVTRSAYDADNRLTSVIDADGHTTKYRYDDADRLRTVAGPDAVSAAAVPESNNPPRPAVTTYTYDAVGHVLSRTDPNGHRYSYSYDAVERLAAKTDPLGRQTTYHYDAESHLTQVVTPGSGDPAPRSIVTTYDILGRKVGQDVGAGDVIYAWGYDAINRPTSVADPFGLRTQIFDEASRVHQVIRDGKDTFTYEYDSDNNITSRTWPDGTAVTSGYNAMGQLTSVQAQGGVAGPQTSAYAFRYDVSGRLDQITYPASTGLVTDRGYDRAGRLVDVNSHRGDTTTVRFQVNRDAVGNPTAITTSRGTDSQTVGYRYDAANRVTAACPGTATCAGPGIGTVTYTYDHVGNRLSQMVNGTTTKYRYDAADELTETTTSGTAGNQTVRYGYDGEGNQIRAGADSFTYHLNHTLASATVAGVKTSYAYDAQGIRLSASTGTPGGPTSRKWLTDVNASLPRLSLEETSTAAGGTTRRGYLEGPNGIPLALARGGQVDSYLLDWLSGVADVIAPDGTTRASYDYDPFGNPRTDGTAGAQPSTVDNPVRFAGGYQDPTLGSRYANGARVYDPATGRFGGQDSEPPGPRTPTTSGYAYVADRPTVDIDPSGKDPEPSYCSATGYASASCEDFRPQQPGYCSASGYASASCESFRPTPPPAKDCAHDKTCIAIHPQVVDEQKAQSKDKLCGDSPSTNPECKGVIQNELYENFNGLMITTVIQKSSDAKIDARLLLSTLIRESGDCHCWQHLKSDWAADSIGMANMQEGAFNEAKRYSQGAITFEWGDLTGQPTKSVIAAAYRLGQLQTNLPYNFNSHYSKEELVRIGYRFTMENFESAYKTDHDLQGSDFVNEIKDFRTAWGVSDHFICHAGIYSC